MSGVKRGVVRGAAADGTVWSAVAGGASDAGDVGAAGAAGAEGVVRGGAGVVRGAAGGAAGIAPRTAKDKVVVINGSPKHRDSTCGKLIEELGRIAGSPFETYQVLSLLREDRYNWLDEVGTLVMVLPLYVDALPSPVVQLLTRLEPMIQTLPHKPRLFVLCVCGFYEAEHTKTALRILHNFADRAGLRWIYGIGLGSGGFVVAAKDMAVGPTKQVHVVLSDFVSDIKQPGEHPLLDIFQTPRIPRVLYAKGGNYDWRRQAKANGVRGQIKARPFTTE